MDPLTPERLLEVWESGVHAHPLDRALLLFALAEPTLPPQRLADQPLGRRNAAIMALRQALFGGPLGGWLDCPACGERMALEIDAQALPAAPPREAALEVAGIRFQRPTSRHLASLIGIGDPAEAARALLAACAESGAALPRDEAALEALLEQLDARLEHDDPWAELSLEAACPACGAATAATLDIAAMLWDEIDGTARHLLDQVHLLAGAYGWHERDILQMSEPRRAAYLERLQA
jgi:hypothetical protein